MDSATSDMEHMSGEFRHILECIEKRRQTHRNTLRETDAQQSEQKSGDRRTAESIGNQRQTHKRRQIYSGVKTESKDRKQRQMYKHRVWCVSEEPQEESPFGAYTSAKADWAALRSSHTSRK